MKYKKRVLFLISLFLIFFSLLYLLTPSYLKIISNNKNENLKYIIEVSDKRLSFNNPDIKIFNKKINDISVEENGNIVEIKSVTIAKMFFKKLFALSGKENSGKDIVENAVRYFNLINIYSFFILLALFIAVSALILIFYDKFEKLVSLDKTNIGFLKRILPIDDVNHNIFDFSASLTAKSKIEKLLSYLFYILLAIFVILGVYLRLFIAPGVDLWYDEAYRAVGYMENGFIHWATVIDNIRPIGYTFLTFIIQKIHNTDFMLRLPSIIAGILTIFGALGLSLRLTKSKFIVLLTSFLVSFNPTLINFSKEFKPYALELFLHLLIVFLLVLYLQKNSDSRLFILLTASFLSIFFAYNILFLLPFVFMLVFLKVINDKNNKHFLLICFTAIMIILSFIIIKVELLNTIVDNKETSSEFWGNKYDVFITDENTTLKDKFVWFLNKTGNLIESSSKNLIFIDLPENVKNIFNNLLRNVSIILFLIGIFSLIYRKKHLALVIFLLPIISLVIANILKFWPYGDFRSNLFVYGYFLFIGMFGFNFLIEVKDKIVKRTFIIIFIALYFVLQFPYNFNFFRTREIYVPTYNAKELINFLYNHERLLEDGLKKNIYTDVHVSAPLKYYVNYNKDTKNKYKELFQKEFNNYPEVIPLFRIPEKDSDPMIIEALRKEKYLYFCFLYNSFSPLFEFKNKEDKRLFALDLFSKYANVKQYILDTNVIFYCESKIFDENDGK